MKFEIEFKHTIEETYTAIVEGEDRANAITIFEEDPFSYLVREYPVDVKGLRIDISSVTEVEDENV